MEKNVTVETKIKFNGQEFASPNDMPPDIRRQYERALAMISVAKRISRFFGMSIPVPDLLPGKIVVDGKEYSSVDEMPTDVRRLYERALSEARKDDNGIPDAFESGRRGIQQSGQNPKPIRQPALKALDEIRPEHANWALVVAGVVVGIVILVFWLL